MDGPPMPDGHEVHAIWCISRLYPSTRRASGTQAQADEPGCYQQPADHANVIHPVLINSWAVAERSTCHKFLPVIILSLRLLLWMRNWRILCAERGQPWFNQLRLASSNVKLLNVFSG